MYKRSDGRWQASYKSSDGKFHTVSGKTKAEVLQKIGASQKSSRCGVLFLKAAEAWAEQHFPTIEPATARGYKASLKRAIDQFGRNPIGNITQQDVFVFLDLLAKRGYGRKTILTQLGVINMILDFSVSQRWLEVNLCRTVRLPAGLKSKRRDLPTDADIEAVRTSDWLYPFFLLYTGLRRSEALAIRYEDIDREAGVIHVHRAVAYDDNKPYIKSTKTEAGVRDVVLLDALAERIPIEGSGYLFPDRDGDVLHNSRCTRLWKKWQMQNGVTCTQHQLRHAFATMLYNAGLPVKDAQYLLGHADAATTQNIYTHISNSRRQAVSEQLNKFVNNNAIYL